MLYPAGSLHHLLTHSSLVVKTSDDAASVLFLCECQLLRSRPRALTLEEASELGHGAVIVWQDDLSTSELRKDQSFDDGRDWDEPVVRYGMHNFRHQDESSKLWKLLFTAKRNTMYNKYKYWHLLAYFDSWDFARELTSVRDDDGYVACLKHMARSYFLPEAILAKKDLPGPFRPIVASEIAAMLPGPAKLPQFGAHLMENFELQRPFARSKVNQIVQEAEIPQDPSMYARRHKGLMWDSARVTLKSLEPQDLGHGKRSIEVSGHVPKEAQDDSLPVIPLEIFRRRFLINPRLEDGLLRDTASIVKLEKFWSLLNALRESPQAVDDKYQNNSPRSTSDALIAFLGYLSTEACLRYRPDHEELQFSFVSIPADSLAHQYFSESSTFMCFPGQHKIVGPRAEYAGHTFIRVATNEPRKDKGLLAGVIEELGRIAEEQGSLSAEVRTLSTFMLASCPARRHVLGVSYLPQERSFWFSFADRGGGLLGGPASLDDENQVEELVATLLGLYSGDTTRWGLHESFIPRSLTQAKNISGTVFQDISDLSLAMGPWCFQLDAPLDSRTDYDDVFRTTRYLAHMVAGPPLNMFPASVSLDYTENVVLSFRWGPDSAEDDQSEDQWHRLANERRVHGVARIFRTHVFAEQEYDGWFRPTAREKLSSMLCASIMEPFIPLDEVEDPEHFREAFRSLVKAHHDLWVSGISHRNMTPEALMVSHSNHQVGILVGLDNAVVRSKNTDSEQSEPESFYDPSYAALDLVRVVQPSHRGDDTLYRFELESFFYSLVWLVCRDIADVDGWLEDSKRKREVFSKIISLKHPSASDRPSRYGVMQSYISRLALIFEKAFEAQEAGDRSEEASAGIGESLDTVVNYESFMDILRM